MMLGRIDEVDGHFIATNFVAGTIPISCVYLAGVGEGNAREVKIRTDLRSVALGYMRVWLPVLAVAFPVLQLATGHLSVGAIITSIALIVIAVVARSFGRLPESEKARLRVLGTVTGFRLDPWRLPDQLRAVKREQLGELMEKGGIPTTPEGIVEVIDDIPVPAMPLVYGYACYSDEETNPAWRECAALVYQRYEQAEAV